MEGLAPPLVDSEWVLGPPDRLARIVLHGVTGPISVNGAVYKMEMPGLPTLSDEEIAGVLTYVRREWEHGADPIDEKMIAAVRKATKDRADLWTEKELLNAK
jgi:mono/diheme cytochrome c family protein